MAAKPRKSAGRKSKAAPKRRRRTQPSGLGKFLTAFDWRRLGGMAAIVLLVGLGGYAAYHWVAGRADRALRDAAASRDQPLPSLRVATTAPPPPHQPQTPQSVAPTVARTLPPEAASGQTSLPEPTPRPSVETAALATGLHDQEKASGPKAKQRPVAAIIIDDVGLDSAAARRAIALPAPVTLSFLPYGRETPQLAAAAKAAGHEVFVHLQMEPEGKADPGPHALLTSLSDKELRTRTEWALDRVPGATGANNHMGSRMTANAHDMRLVLAELDRRQMAFIDSRTSAASVAAETARAMGVPTASRDVFLDNEQSEQAIMKQLDDAWRVAQRRGSVIAIGHPHPSTLAALKTWIGRMRGQLVFVAATDLIDVQRCRNAQSGEAAMACASAERVAQAPD